MIHLLLVRKIVIFLVFLISFSIASCDPSVGVTFEMEGFLKAIKSSNSMDIASVLYGYTNDEMPLGYYDVKEPHVINSTTEGTQICYNLTLKHGITESKIKVCWEEGKIVTISELE